MFDLIGVSFVTVWTLFLAFFLCCCFLAVVCLLRDLGFAVMMLFSAVFSWLLLDLQFWCYCC